MDFSQLKALVLCFAVLALVGCSTASKTPRYVNPQALQVASMVGDAQPGDYIALPAQSGLGADNVVVDRTYIAASGRQCRRLRTVDGRPVQRVACKGSDGIWLLARDLRSVSSLDVTAGSGTKSSVVRFADEPDQTLVPVVNPPRLAGAEPVTIVPIEPAVQEYAVPVEAVPLQFSAADASMLQRAESLIISRPDHARRMGARPLIETLDNRVCQTQHGQWAELEEDCPYQWYYGCENISRRYAVVHPG